jgi:hypothetical protein
MSATTERNWKQQFPSWPDDITALVTELESLGFTDESWGNDACPSFHLRVGNSMVLVVWIDCIDPSMRDCGEQSCRFGFSINTCDASESLTYLRGIGTDDWSAIITASKFLGGK